MSNISALERFTAAQNKRKKLIAENKAIFDEYERIGGEIIDADNALRDSVAESKEGCQNDEWVVSFTPQTQTYADIEKIDQLIAGGVIPASKRDEIVKTVDRPARITIRPQA